MGGRWMLNQRCKAMRTLNAKEAEKLKTRGPGRRTRVRAEIEAMAVGGHLLLERADWTQKTRSPKTMVRDVGRAMRREYACEMLIDSSGWLITRLS